jgi:CBS domain-containing protein
MRQWDIGILLVVEDLFSRRVVGIITDRDLCLATLVGGRDPARGMVIEFMTCDPVCCSPADDPHYVLQLMRDHQVRRVPVVEGGEIVGIVSLTDMARYGAISEHELLAALGRISEPTAIAAAEAKHHN